MIINTLPKILKSKGRGKFVYPYYGGYCISNIPPTVLSLLKVKTDRQTLHRDLLKKVKSKGINKVILILLDGFGFEHWRIANESKFFNAFSRKGVVAPITTVFPSTTAAALTTVSTGLTPQEHSLLEWIVYFKELDMVLATLPFKPVNKRYDKEFKRKAKPGILLKEKTVFDQLKKAKVKSFVLMQDIIADSEYSKLSYHGAKVIPYGNAARLAVNLRRQLDKTKGKAYFYVYWPGIDSAEHAFGPNTDEHFAEISLFAEIIRREFVEKVSKAQAKKTLVIITADHGQVNVNPKKTIYLNKYKKLVKSFQRGPKGRSIYPTGSPREVFLHIKPEKLQEIKAFLQKKLRGKADILETKKAIQDGLFGIGITKKEFLDRVGNLMILPRKNKTVWFRHTRGEKFNLNGHHGSLTGKEMLIPFAAARLSDLIDSVKR